MEPIRLYTVETKLTDGVEVEIVGQVFGNAIFTGGIPVYNVVEIINKSTGVNMGIAYYQNPMEQEELETKVKEVSNNPEPFLLPVYRKQILN